MNSVSCWDLNWRGYDGFDIFKIFIIEIILGESQGSNK